MTLFLTVGISNQGLSKSDPVNVPKATTSSSVIVAQVNPPSLAFTYTSILGNRTRMIQVATVFMLIGIGFLMWNRS